MVPIFVSSLVLMNKRRTMELFDSQVRKLWSDWELKIMVLLSLTLQTVLILFGNRRKYSVHVWIRIVVWSAYLMADAVAAYALGIILNNIGEMYNDSGHLDKDTELAAFWAPFLLVHLGGPDTITAYALEDNELWLRHVLGLVVQAAVTVYVFLMAWTGSSLSYLTILIILAGVIKYGERVWVLYSASFDKFRDSCLEKKNVMKGQTVQYGTMSPDIKAYHLIQTFKSLFVDLILSNDDRVSSQSAFRDLKCEEAFEVIAIELGFMYDMIYTKAMVVYTAWGLGMRFISLFFTCFVLVFFSFSEKHYKPFDISLTFLLLSGAIVVELYAIMVSFSSDWTNVWLAQLKKIRLLSAIGCLQPSKHHRWSNSVAQYSLLSLSLNEKPPICKKLQQLLHIDKILENLRYTTHEELSNRYEDIIYSRIMERFKQFEESDSTRVDAELKAFYTSRGVNVLEKYGHLEIKWSVEIEFDQSILTWYIATEICFYTDASQTGENSPDDIAEKCDMSKCLSQYMLYLLAVYPIMLPVGMGQVSFRDTCAEAVHFFEEQKSTIKSSSESDSTEAFQHPRHELLDKMTACEKQACWMLLNVDTEIQPFQVRGDRSKSVLFDACRLAQELKNVGELTKKWDIISRIWVYMLAYAASQCRGNNHAQQLRRGGELLTHVWLLMAHLGLTEHFHVR